MMKMMIGNHLHCDGTELEVCILDFLEQYPDYELFNEVNYYLKEIPREPIEPL